MGTKELKNRRQLGSAVNNKLADELKAYSEQTGIPISKLLDKAIEMFLKSVK